MINAVIFDVGETLVDETHEYGTWADWLGVPRHTFSSVFGAVIAAGHDYREVFQYFKPGFDLSAERERRAEAGLPESFTRDNLYQDALPCLESLRDMGIWIGIAGNQTLQAGAILRSFNLPADMIAMSAELGVSKPESSFFDAVITASPYKANELLYVGDRLDNDLKPAKAAGMSTAFIRRGPWGYIWSDHPDIAEAADWCIDTLTELPELVASVSRSGH